MFQKTSYLLIVSLILFQVVYASFRIKLVSEPEMTIETRQEGVIGSFEYIETTTMTSAPGIGIGMEYSTITPFNTYVSAGFDYFFDRNVTKLKRIREVNEIPQIDESLTLDDAKYQVIYPYFKIGYKVERDTGVGLFFRIPSYDLGGSDFQSYVSDPQGELSIGFFVEYLYQDFIGFQLFVGENNLLWDQEDFDDIVYSKQKVMTVSIQYVVGSSLDLGFGSKREKRTATYWGN